MADNTPDTTNFIIKMTLYVIGVLLGVSSKLAIKHKNKPLTFKLFAGEAVVAGAAAWLTWWVLCYFGKQDLAVVSAVVVGRYGDAILIASWRFARGYVLAMANKDMEDDI